MRQTVTLVAAIVVTAAAAWPSAKAAPPGMTELRQAGEAITVLDEVRCWRWGWHGWGWYPECAKPADPCLKCQWHWGKHNCWRTC
jgi:hypothetical protein